MKLRHRPRWVFPEQSIVKNSADSVNRYEGVLEEVGSGEAGPIDGEVGGGVVGDEERETGEEGGEADAVEEEAELGEGEAAGDNVVREEKGVEEVEGDCRRRTADSGEKGVVVGDEEGGGDGYNGGVHCFGKEVGPVAEVPCSDQGVDDGVELNLVV